MLKRKNAGAGIADVDKSKNIVIGYASKFDNIDSHGDIVLKGAFKRTIDHNGRRVKTLMHHDPVSIVGKPTLMKEDDGGLYTESRISKTAMGQDLMTLIEDEVIDEMSIGYIPVREGFDDEKGANLIHEVKLVEYSFVTLASNDEARVEGVKGTAALNEIVSSMRRMEKALRGSEFVSDEVPERLEFAIKYWRSVLESSTKDLEVVQNPDVVSSTVVSGDSSEEDTRTQDSDPAPATRSELLDILSSWQKEQEVLGAIYKLGESLGRK
ncbi:MAG: HK97 family phage prohead protease [Actinobacteria bacterium]|nr:HK97 family phage prohead protease [Actinomycetota bacterium]